MERWAALSWEIADDWSEAIGTSCREGDALMLSSRSRSRSPSCGLELRYVPLAEQKKRSHLLPQLFYTHLDTMALPVLLQLREVLIAFFGHPALVDLVLVVPYCATHLGRHQCKRSPQIQSD